MNITLDSKGGWQMGYATRDNIGRRLGVLFIEYKTKLEKSVSEKGDIELISVPYVRKNIISLATIQAQLESSSESQDLTDKENHLSWLCC